VEEVAGRLDGKEECPYFEETRPIHCFQFMAKHLPTRVSRDNRKKRTNNGFSITEFIH
jgi:hypothetical protein